MRPALTPPRRDQRIRWYPKRDQGFESCSLQQRVNKLSVPLEMTLVEGAVSPLRTRLLLLGQLRVINACDALSVKRPADRDAVAGRERD